MYFNFRILQVKTLLIMYLNSLISCEGNVDVMLDVLCTVLSITNLLRGGGILERSSTIPESERTVSRDSRPSDSKLMVTKLTWW